MREADDCSNMDIAALEDFSAEGDICRLAADRSNIVFERNCATIGDFIARHIRSK
jgi:hypothetical protein